MNKNERIETLKNAGIDSGKYITLSFPDGLEAGTVLKIQNSDVNNDNIANNIIEDGYVKNTQLYRRFVMAQMFSMLNHPHFKTEANGFNESLRLKPYDYTINMMIEEVRVLSELEVRDNICFAERHNFFNKKVISNVLIDYLEKMNNFIKGLPRKKCREEDYVRINGRDIFVKEIPVKITNPIKKEILKFCNDMVHSGMTYRKIYLRLCSIRKKMIKLPKDTSKSSVWIDTFKGEGAYYTLKNLCLFNNCFIIDYKTENKYVTAIEKADYLREKLNEYKGEGYKMFALMNKVIADNHYDFYAEMKKKYESCSNVTTW